MLGEELSSQVSHTRLGLHCSFSAPVPGIFQNPALSYLTPEWLRVVPSCDALRFSSSKTVPAVSFGDTGLNWAALIYSLSRTNRQGRDAGDPGRVLRTINHDRQPGGTLESRAGGGARV